MFSKLFQGQPFDATLSRNIALRVFLCFVAIEVVVLFPSYSRRESQLSEEYETQAQTILQPWIGLSKEELKPDLQQKILYRAIADTDLTGLTLYDSKGQKVLVSGEEPQTNLKDWEEVSTTTHYIRSQKVIEVFVTAKQLNANYDIVARFDATFLHNELRGYVFRIIALVLLIGAIVTLGTILTLYPKVLQPIYQLREDLLIVGEAISQDNSKPPMKSQGHRNDELGEVINVFHSFVGEIYTAIQARKQVEVELMSLNETLQEEIQHRQEIEANLQALNKQLQGLANSDGLTQVANRRYFDECLLREWKRMARQREPISLILFDVDFFKQFNDAYGHQVGDDCLISIAKASQTVIQRPGDLLARYGGEEFVVILPHTDRDGAKVVAENIRLAIAAQEIPHNKSAVSDFVTVSLGVSTQIPMPTSLPDDFLKQADTALYQAKAQGRNRLCCAQELPTTSVSLPKI